MLPQWLIELVVELVLMVVAELLVRLVRHCSAGRAASPRPPGAPDRRPAVADLSHSLAPLPAGHTSRPPSGLT